MTEYFSFIRTTCKKKFPNNGLSDDLCSEICIKVLDLDNKLCNDLIQKNKFKSYLCVMIHNLAYSVKSPFRKVHLPKSHDMIIEQQYEDVDYNKLNEVFARITDLQHALLAYFMQGFSDRRISTETGIDRNVVSRERKAIENYVKLKL